MRQASRWLVLILCFAAMPSVYGAETVKPSPSVRISDEVSRLINQVPGARLNYALQRCQFDLQHLSRSISGNGLVNGITLQEFQESRLLYFVPANDLGQLMPVVAWDPASSPEPGTLYLDCRDDRTLLIVMGADGDPLTPLIREVQTTGTVYGPMFQGQSWHEVQQHGLRSSLLAQLRAYQHVRDAIPSSWDDVATVTGLAAYNHWVLPPESVPSSGLTLAVDTTETWLRVQYLPDTGYGNPRYYPVDPARANLGPDRTQAPTEATYRVLYAAEWLPADVPVATPMPPKNQPKHWLQVQDEEEYGRLMLAAYDLYDLGALWPVAGSLSPAEALRWCTFTHLTRAMSPLPVIDAEQSAVQLPDEYLQFSSIVPGNMHINITAGIPQPDGTSRSAHLAAFRGFSFDEDLGVDRVQAGSSLPPPTPGALMQEAATWLQPLRQHDRDFLARRILMPEGPLEQKQLVMAIERTATLLSMIVRKRGTIPGDWSTVLRELRLQPRAFRILNPGQEVAAGAWGFELATILDDSLMRVRVTIPGLPQGDVYLRCPEPELGVVESWTLLDPDLFLSLATMPWETSLRAEMLPVEPYPVLPE